jgi:IMP cyclohydrolase
MFKNPYIAYNCLKTSDRYFVVTNGSHTDFVYEKLQAGLDLRDALALVLLSMDYEHDSLSTPRIAAVADLKTGTTGLGIVRKDAVLVQTLDLKAGEAFYIATYEHNYISDEFSDKSFDVRSSQEACEYIIKKGVFAGLTLPIAAASVMDTGKGLDISFQNL